MEETLDKQSEIEEYMILGLRMMKGVSKSEFFKRFGETMDMKYGEVLAQLKSLELITEEDDFVCLTEKGIDVSNEIFTMFME